jgi:hypothetical protein
VIPENAQDEISAIEVSPRLRLFGLFVRKLNLKVSRCTQFAEWPPLFISIVRFITAKSLHSNDGRL